MQVPKNNYGEVDPVPAVAQVGVFVDDKAHGKDLECCLEREEPREGETEALQSLVSPCEVVAVVVVVDGERERVEEDEADDNGVERAAESLARRTDLP